jgi:hypothetical protein
MFGKKDPKTPVGALGSGLPYEDFETAVASPDSVRDNLEKMRPMIQAIRVMARTEGWDKYVRPFLEKQQNPSRILEMIEKGEDAKTEAGRIKAYAALLNLVNSTLRTGASLDKLATQKEAQDALGDREG